MHGAGRRYNCRMKKILAGIDFAADSSTVARQLIGVTLLVDGVGGRIVETEAYDRLDPASHTYGGMTPRNAAMFGPPAHAYVYRSYGIHWCLNIVCREPGHGAGVLIRAIEPLAGVELMQHRRKGAKGRLLTGGPGRLTMAMGIDRSFYGEDLTGNRLWIEKGEGNFPVKRTKRIGIDYAKYGRNFPWRMVLEDNIYVSK